MSKYSNKEVERLAKALAVTCVRNTFLETLHSDEDGGSKISDDEMKTLMKDVVDRLYTVLTNIDDEKFMSGVFKLGDQYSAKWDKPELVPGFILPTKKQAS